MLGTWRRVTILMREDPLFALPIPGKVQWCLAYGRSVVAAAGDDGEERRRNPVADSAFRRQSGPTCRGSARAAASARKTKRDHGKRERAQFEGSFERAPLRSRQERRMREVVKAR
jgi:hypothetical protein